MSTIERAVSLACEGHSGQLDKAGQPYILHCLRVMQAQTTEIGMIVGVLHDYLEDVKEKVENENITKLWACGFDYPILSTLVTLKKQPAVSYDVYIEAVAADPPAVPIKIADLKDNMNTLRLSTFTDRDAQRLIKYHKALRRLESIKL